MNKTFMQKLAVFFKTAFTEKILITIPVIIIIGLLITSLGSYIYMKSYLNSKGTGTETSELIIEQGESVRVICKELKTKGLIKKELPLLIYLKITGKAGDLKAGEYKIAHNLTPIEIVDVLTNGKVASRKITIPEGWTAKQIGQYLEKEGIVSKADFLVAASKKYDYWFLKDKPENVNLEGFLFPDTYQVSMRVTADEIVQKMLNNFDKKISGDIKLEIEASKMNPYEVITLASIVEKEVSKPEDRKVVAGIFEKRLESDMPLQSDVTVKYFLDTEKNSFTNAETSIPSPYNTYLNRGLPLGPICNPGLDSISAVLKPTTSDYWYFLAAKGITYYAKTLDQQEANRNKYLQ